MVAPTNFGFIGLAERGEEVLGSFLH